MAIREVLLQDWDPIGIGDNPNISDEYDSYIPAIQRLLVSDCELSELLSHLKKVEQEEIGVEGTDYARLKAAQKLLEILDIKDLQVDRTPLNP